MKFLIFLVAALFFMKSSSSSESSLLNKVGFWTGFIGYGFTYSYLCFLDTGFFKKSIPSSSSSSNKPPFLNGFFETDLGIEKGSGYGTIIDYLCLAGKILSSSSSLNNVEVFFGFFVSIKGYASTIGR